MPATAQFQPQLTYQQVVRLWYQLPAQGRQKLAELLPHYGVPEKSWGGDF